MSASAAFWKKSRQGQGDAETLPQPREDLHRVQRVAAQREEVVVPADAGHAQDFAPDARQRDLGGRFRVGELPPQQVAEACTHLRARHLALRVSGKRGDAQDLLGHLELRQLLRGEPAQVLSPSASAPSLSTTAATTASPRLLWATPNTQASRTAGCASSAASTSGGATFCPPRLMMSLIRPVR